MAQTQVLETTTKTVEFAQPAGGALILSAPAEHAHQNIRSWHYAAEEKAVMDAVRETFPYACKKELCADSEKLASVPLDVLSIILEHLASRGKKQFMKFLAFPISALAIQVLALLFGWVSGSPNAVFWGIPAIFLLLGILDGMSVSARYFLSYRKLVKLFGRDGAHRKIYNMLHDGGVKKEQ